ncbi:MAG TPA: alginate export family protein [Chiayiivirga sp.]|nr:alginate export family protein [Chiayiivirga sp.]
MKMLKILGIGLSLASLVAANGVQAAEGKPIFDVRYRYEHVEQDNALAHAVMNSVRTRLGYATGVHGGFSALVEVDHVGHLGGDYNDTRNGHTGRSLIPDPSGAAVNQAWVRHSGDYGSLTVGRQRINLGNQRFVGGVGWRQNEQTYDGAMLQLNPGRDLALSYAYIGRVNTIWGPDTGAFATAVNPARVDGDSHLFDLRWAITPSFSLGAYHYRLGLDDLAIAPTAARGTLSSATTGLRAQGRSGALDYVLEYAMQKDAEDNPLALDSRYHLIEVGYAFEQVKLRAGQEVLGAGSGAGNRAFQTPLATKHAFQGWADMFLTTPADGVDDRYVGVTVPLGGGNLQGWYHDFTPERGGGDYGSEFDLSYARPIPGIKGLSGLVKYASYSSDDRARTVDTDKFWVQLQYAF